MNAWIPMNVGEREVTDKKVRRALRDAKNLAEHAVHAHRVAVAESQEETSMPNGLDKPE